MRLATQKEAAQHFARESEHANKMLAQSIEREAECRSRVAALEAENERLNQLLADQSNDHLDKVDEILEANESLRQKLATYERDAAHAAQRIGELESLDSHQALVTFRGELEQLFDALSPSKAPVEMPDHRWVKTTPRSVADHHNTLVTRNYSYSGHSIEVLFCGDEPVRVP